MGEEQGRAGVEVDLGARCRWEGGTMGNKQVLFQSSEKTRCFPKLKWSTADGLGLK